jgi:hypothetical protein
MSTLTEAQHNILKSAAQNNGRIWVLTPGWWTTPNSVGGPWSTASVNKLISLGLIAHIGDDVELTEEGRELLESANA